MQKCQCFRLIFFRKYLFDDDTFIGLPIIRKPQVIEEFPRFFSAPKHPFSVLIANFQMVEADDMKMLAFRLNLIFSVNSGLPRRYQALDRLIKSLFLDRLQKIINGIHIEGLNRVMGIGGDKDDIHKMLLIEKIRHRQTVDVSHLDVEKYDVGFHTRDFSQRGLRFRITGDNFDILVMLQKRRHDLDRMGLIVDNNRFHDTVFHGFLQLVFPPSAPARAD